MIDVESDVAIRDRAGRTIDPADRSRMADNGIDRGMWSRTVDLHGDEVPVWVERSEVDGDYRVYLRGEVLELRIERPRDRRLDELLRSTASGRPAGSLLRAPMPGLVKELLVAPGDNVERGTPLLILEAMKMENELRADAEYIVSSVEIEAGSPVEKGAVLVRLEPPSTERVDE